jgi:hypothetical protein
MRAWRARTTSSLSGTRSVNTLILLSSKSQALHFVAERRDQFQRKVVVGEGEEDRGADLGPVDGGGTEGEGRDFRWR